MTPDDATTLPEAAPLRVRPSVPLRKHEDLSPSTIAKDFKNLDDSLGALPLRFVRSARSLADRLNCREEWDRVEECHEALRTHEVAP